MIDFLLDIDKDDIILGPSRRSNSLSIQFNIGQKTNKLKIQFFVETVTRPKLKTNALNIKFKVKPKEDDYLNKKLYSVDVCKDNEDYEVQQIMLRLKTELGEVQPYSDYGSRLVEYRHEDKFDKSNLHEIKEIVEGIVDIDKYDVYVTPNVDDHRIMAWHNIHIKIISKYTGKVLKGFVI
jgi:hypothetical protein|nr:MAG TPA: hypothetical protein [Caudoviricetes sp.]